MDKSESENVLSHPKEDKKAEHDNLSDEELMSFDTCIGNFVRELRNAQKALKYLGYINADMCKLEGKVHEVQEEHRKRLAKSRKTMSESESKSESILSYLRGKKVEHNYLSDQELVSFDTCIDSLVRGLRNVQIALVHLEYINDNIHELEGKAREVQEEHWKRLAKSREA